MNLTTATNVTQSALATVSAESNVVSRNIAGANRTGLFAEDRECRHDPDGGVEVASVTNAQNQALFDNVLSATSASATQSAISGGLTTLQTTVGEPGTDTSPAEKLSDLTDALQQYEASPSNSSLAQRRHGGANSGEHAEQCDATVQQVREQADSQMASSVSTINSLLTQFQSVNQQIVTGTATGNDVTDLLDTRNSLLTQLSQQIGITTRPAQQRHVDLYRQRRDSVPGGHREFGDVSADQTYTASTTGNAVYIDGIPVTGSSATMPIQSGAFAGLANLRDNVTVTYQAQLDQTANGLINSFAETDPANPSSTLAGLFTDGGSTAMPSAAP